MPAADSLTLDSLVVHSKKILSNTIDSETVLLSIEKNSYYGLGPVASQIWCLIEQPITVAALISLLEQQFDVARETCERDVLQFLQQLRSEGLLDSSDS